MYERRQFTISKSERRECRRDVAGDVYTEGRKNRRSKVLGKEGKTIEFGY